MGQGRRSMGLPVFRSLRLVRTFRRFLLWLLAAFAGMCALAAQAAPQIEVLRGLDFGALAVTSNAVPSSLVLSPQGSASYGAGMVFVAASTPGRYRLSGYPAFTDMVPAITPTPLHRGGSGMSEALMLAQVVTRPATLRTDASGSVEFDLGATLSLSGTGQPYEDGHYRATATLTLSFEHAGQPVFSYQDIEATVEVRSTLGLVQVQSLDFGRLSVSGSAADQASLTISPNGIISVHGPGQARIVRLLGGRPGIFRVLSGAAFAPVNVVLPAEPVELRHQSQSPEVASLLVTDFTTYPSGQNLKLNALGEMEFHLGATLRTEQGVRRYVDGEYSATFPLSVEY